MPFEPVARRPVSELVFDELSAAILQGRYAPGDPLPPERALSEAFVVNRHAVREALKRLQQAGLVRVHHGGATRVLDWRTTAGLDLLAQLPFAGAQVPDPALLRSVVEARRWIGLDVARLAAERAGVEAIAGLRARVAPGDGPAREAAELAERYEELWRALVAASGNVAYLLAYNSLLAAGHAAPAASREVFAAEAADLPAQAALVEAVAAHDPQRALACADVLLSRSLHALPDAD
jgi:DNA-binding FadR family transcriptional regulator